MIGWSADDLAPIGNAEEFEIGQPPMVTGLRRIA
jgi:hypothetical protein